MPQQRRAVILSDLHMGPDNDLCSFRDEEPLAALLSRLTDEAGATPTELVLAGDLFDFLQVEGYDGFDAGISVQRFDEILRSPRTATVMEALRRLTQRPDVEVTVLAGNHDPELLVPSVREHFEGAIGRKGCVLYAGDEPLRPGAGERLPVWGRALGDEGRAVWVIHGDRWDTLNAIHHGTFREAIAAGEPVALSAGSDLVFEALQKLKPTYGWIDRLKPEAAVLVLLIYLDPLRAKEFFQKHLGLTARIVRGMARVPGAGAAVPRRRASNSARRTSCRASGSSAKAPSGQKIGEERTGLRLETRGGQGAFVSWAEERTFA